MKLYFILKYNDIYHVLEGTFHSNVLHLDDTIMEIDNISTLSDKKLISLEDLGNNNYNLLEIINATTLRNLRKQLFNKTYIPKTIEKKLNIMIDCFLEMYKRELIKFNDNEITEDKTINEFIENEVKSNDNEITKDKTINELIENKVKSNDNSQNIKNINSKIIILLSLGFITGFYIKKYLVK